MIEIATKFKPTLESYRIATQAGFRRVELWTDAVVLSQWRQVVDLTQSIGQRFDHAVHFPNRLEQSPETLEHTVSLCRALNATALIIHQPHMDRYGAELLRQEPTLPIAVENHKLSRDGFEKWASHNPGLTLDVEHLWKFTLPELSLAQLLDFVREWLARYAPKLRHVHMPGYLPGQEEHRPMYCSRDMCMGMLTLLEEVAFAGLIVSEVNPEFQNVEELQMDLLLQQRWRALQGSIS